VDGPLYIEGKKIRSDYAYVYAGMKEKGVLADLRFKTYIRPRMQLVAGINYKLPVSGNDFLIIKEKKWIAGKTAFQPMNERVIYTENDIRSTVSAFNPNRWMITLGVSFVY